MNAYLTFITTVLVLTQVIRITQNAIQLRRVNKAATKDREVLEMWERMTDAINRFVDKV
jgi:hypothetical protein